MVKIRKKLFSLQVDEFTDINFAHLIPFTCFIGKDIIINQFLCCKSYPQLQEVKKFFIY